MPLEQEPEYREHGHCVACEEIQALQAQPPGIVQALVGHRVETGCETGEQAAFQRRCLAELLICERLYQILNPILRRRLIEAPGLFEGQWRMRRR